MQKDLVALYRRAVRMMLSGRMIEGSLRIKEYQIGGIGSILANPKQQTAEKYYQAILDGRVDIKQEQRRAV
jgi:hypothetical protein